MLEVRVKKKLKGFLLDVAFAVNREILAILGPSGSGKTMTLQCIAGLVKPDEGYIRLDDDVLLDTKNSIAVPARHRGVGFVFQNYALFPHLTVVDNISYGIRHMERDERLSRVGDLLTKMHLVELGHRYPSQLSAGQQQRVALARAIAPEPALLLLDEPFSALDAQVKERMELELLNLHEFYKGTILFVTHNLAEGFKLASKIAVYESGRIVQCDEKNTVIDSPANRIVARLTGVRNMMPGTIIHADGTRMRVFVPELGGEVSVTSCNRSFAAGQQVTIGIRPEYVRMVDEPGDNSFHCSVSRIVEGVSLINCFFQPPSSADGGHWLEVSLHKAHGPRLCEGNKCYVHLPSEHVILVEGTTTGVLQQQQPGQCKSNAGLPMQIQTES